jgi:nucleoside phosphorylase
VLLLAISSYPDEFEGVRERFERRGCILADYNKEDVWKAALKIMVAQMDKKEQLEFIIFAALPIERAPYTGMPELNGKSLLRGNLQCYDIELAGRKGTVILLPKMGLVNASITAAVAIDRYNPKFVAMSGICAGFSNKAKLGELLISEMVYEYQSGKWTGDGFSQDPYQVPMDDHLRALVSFQLEDTDLLRRLELDYPGRRPRDQSPPRLAVFTSGSAVIADDKYMDQIMNHHRKVSGLDMEVYAIHKAGHSSQATPAVFCAKTVVDLADEDKDDELHKYGSLISARFVIEMLEQLLKSETMKVRA